MSTELPIPPVELDPLRFRLRAGTRLWRVHPVRYTAVQFNPNTASGQRSGRFHPFADAAGKPVPTLYAANRIEGALAETVFHNVRGGERLFRRRLRDMASTAIATQSELLLADLRGFGLRRLGLLRHQLLETPANQYRATAAWAQALYLCDPAIQGIIWVSRQFDQARALVLFGDRIAAEALEPTAEPIPLADGPGFARIQVIASRAGIAIIE